MSKVYGNEDANRFAGYDRRLLIHIFDILTGQGLLSKEENKRLKLELAEETGRGSWEQSESWNI